MTTNSLFRGVTLAGAALLVITFAHRTASADEIFIAGSTLACFGAGCTPGEGASTSLGMTFNNSTFAITTTSGFGVLTGTANATPGLNFNNLGSFTMSPTPGNLVGHPFTLVITFTAPQGFTGSNQITVAGTISDFGMNRVIFEWDPFSSTLSFNDLNCEPNPTTCGTGSFVFTLNDVVVAPGETVAITGSISRAEQQPIPEPTTMLLLGTGLAGVAIKARRTSKVARVSKKPIRSAFHSPHPQTKRAD